MANNNINYTVTTKTFKDVFGDVVTLDAINTNSIAIGPNKLVNIFDMIEVDTATLLYGASMNGTDRVEEALYELFRLCYAIAHKSETRWKSDYIVEYIITNMVDSIKNHTLTKEIISYCKEVANEKWDDYERFDREKRGAAHVLRELMNRIDYEGLAVYRGNIKWIFGWMVGK